MFSEHLEIIDTFEKHLIEIVEKMKSSIRLILNDTLNNKDIYSLFFVCEDCFGDMNIKFFGIDNSKKVFVKKDTFTEIKEPLFPKDLQEKEYELVEKYEFDEDDEENEDFGDSRFEYHNLQREKLFNWFMLCWESIKGEFNNIPQTYFTFGNYAESEMGSYTIDLFTNKKLTNNERLKLLKSLKR